MAKLSKSAVLAYAAAPLVAFGLAVPFLIILLGIALREIWKQIDPMKPEGPCPRCGSNMFANWRRRQDECPCGYGKYWK